LAQKYAKNKWHHPSFTLSSYLEKLSQVVALYALILRVLPLSWGVLPFLLPLIHFCFHFYLFSNLYSYIAECICPPWFSLLHLILL